MRATSATTKTAARSVSCVLSQNTTGCSREMGAWLEQKEKVKELLASEEYKTLMKKRSTECETVFNQTKGNPGFRNFHLRAIAFVREHYIKLCAANAAKKQEQCAEDQKRPIAGERRNDGCGQERQAEQQRKQPLLQQRRGPRKELLHSQHRSKTICLCR